MKKKKLQKLIARAAKDVVTRELNADLSWRVGSIWPRDAQADKHRVAAGSALTLRFLEASGANRASIDNALPFGQRAAGWEDLRYASWLDLARECLRADGLDPDGCSREEVAIAAMGWPQKTSIRGDRVGAYHTTGSFPKLTQDAMNKSMMLGYTEVAPTWRIVGRQGAPAPDFKQIHRMRIGAVPNAPAWPDNTEPADVSFADADEPYAIEAYSEKVTFSYRLLVNDDVGALGRVVRLLGSALLRTQNAQFWAQVTGNPTLGDGQPLFCSAAAGNRLQVNRFTGVAPPSSSNLQTATNALMQMRGENTPENNKGPDILNLAPYAIVGPSALDTAILQLVKSPWDISLSTAQFQAWNPAGRLVPVIEPLLDANSTVAWYVWASPGQIDTVELTFLQGQEEPVLRDWVSEETLSRSWAVLQTFATKALQWRGIVKQVGA